MGEWSVPHYERQREWENRSLCVFSWIQRGCFTFTFGCGPSKKKKPLAVILHFKTPQFVSNPFSGKSVLRSEDVTTPKQSLSLAHLFILIKDWTLYDEMRRGPPDPSCGDRIEKIELTLHPYHVGNTPTRLSLCGCRIPASRRSWQLLCWEKREPCPRMSWYVGLSEDDSCRHNLLLTSWYGCFPSAPPLSLRAPLAPRCSQRLYTLQENIPYGIDSYVYCFLPADSAVVFTSGSYLTVFRVLETHFHCSGPK